jgi:hypothetical protein
MRYLEFDRTPSTVPDHVLMSVTVEYGGRSEMPADMPFADQIRRIDGGA